MYGLASTRNLLNMSHVSFERQRKRVACAPNPHAIDSLNLIICDCCVVLLPFQGQYLMTGIGPVGLPSTYILCSQLLCNVAHGCCAACISHLLT